MSETGLPPGRTRRPAGRTSRPAGAGNQGTGYRLRRREVEERTARVSPRSARLSFLALAVCLVILGAALGGVFRVRQVVVVGDHVPPSEIVSASSLSGQNIFTVRSDQVVSRLEAVHDVTVQRVDTSFPDRVTIYARVRVPFIAWQNGGALFLLDRDGQVIRQVSGTQLPIIVGANPSLSSGPGIVQAVRYAVQVLPGTPNGSVATFHFDAKSGLTIVGRSGWTADVGSGTPQTLVNRVATLASFLQNIQSRPQHLVYVDLRFRVPYARFSGG